MIGGEESNGKPDLNDPALSEIISDHVESYTALKERGEALSNNITDLEREIDSADEESKNEVTTLEQQLKKTRREGTRRIKELLERVTNHLRSLQSALQNHRLFVLIIGASGVGAILLSNNVKKQDMLAITLVYLLLVGFVFVFLSLKYGESDKKDDALMRSIAEDLYASEEDIDGYSRRTARKSHPKKVVGGAKRLISTMMPFLYEFIPQLNKIVTGIDSIEKRRNLIKGVKFSLSRYSFELTPELESVFDEFISIHEEHDLWLSKLLKKLSEYFEVPIEVLSLIYYESMGSTGPGRQEWTTIKGDAFLIDKMAKCIVRNGAFVPLKVSDEKVAINVLKAALKEVQDDYSSRKLETKLADYTNSLIGTQEALRQITKEYDINSEKELTIDKFLPKTIANAHIEYVREAAKLYTISPDILQLIYESSISKEKAISAYSFFKGDHNNMEELSRFLLSGRIRLKSITETDLSTIIVKQPFFRLNVLRGVLDRYEDLVDFIQRYEQFLERQNVRCDTISNGDLFEIVNDPLSQDIFSEYQVLSNKMIIEDTTASPLLHLDDVQFKAMMTNACLSIFFESTDRQMLKQSCKTAYLDNNATLVLFALILQRTDNKNESDVTLKMACQKASEDITSLPYYQDFLAGLSNGLLPPDTRSLATYAINAAKNELQAYTAEALNYGLNLSQILDSVKDSIRQFLESEISITEIDDFLKNELIKAFIVTSPFREPMIEFLKSDAFSDALSEFKKQDKRFEIFEKLSMGAGWGTRVGVIPPQTDFSSASDLFDTLVRRAKDIARDKYQGERYESITLYMLRISPTKEMMAVLGDSPKESLNDLIRQQWVEAALISENTVADALTTMSSVGKRKISSMPLKFILETLFNKEGTTLTFLARPIISDIISKSKTLSKEIETTIEIDRKLKKTYGVKSLTELGNIIGSRVKQRGEKVVRKEFAERLRYAVSRRVINDDDFEMYSEALFSTCKCIGSIMMTSPTSKFQGPNSAT